MHEWIAEMQTLARRHPKRYATLDEAVARMREANPHLTPAQAHHLTLHGCYRDEDGTFLWKFDNYVRAASPYLFNMRDARELWQEITCPVLLLRGEDSWASDPGEGRPRFRLPRIPPGERAEGRALGAPRPARDLPEGGAGVSKHPLTHGAEAILRRMDGGEPSR